MMKRLSIYDSWKSGIGWGNLRLWTFFLLMLTAPLHTHYQPPAVAGSLDATSAASLSVRTLHHHQHDDGHSDHSRYFSELESAAIDHQHPDHCHDAMAVLSAFHLLEVDQRPGNAFGHAVHPAISLIYAIDEPPTSRSATGRS